MALTNLALVRVWAGAPTTNEISDEFITDALARNANNIRLSVADVLEARGAASVSQSVSKSIGGTFNYGAQKLAQYYLDWAKWFRDVDAGLNPAYGTIEMLPGEGGIQFDELAMNEILRDNA